jgi:hypothetical protein
VTRTIGTQSRAFTEVFDLRHAGGIERLPVQPIQYLNIRSKARAATLLVDAPELILEN